MGVKEACPKGQNSLKLEDLLEIAISSEDLGIINFNALRLLLSDMIKKLDKIDTSPVKLGDLDANQIANYKSFIQGENLAPPGVIRVSQDADLQPSPSGQLETLNLGPPEETKPGEEGQLELEKPPDPPQQPPCTSVIHELLENYDKPEEDEEEEEEEDEEEEEEGAQLPNDTIMPDPHDGALDFSFDNDSELDFGAKDFNCPPCMEKKHRSCHCFIGGFDNEPRLSPQQSIQNYGQMGQPSEIFGHSEHPTKAKAQFQQTVSYAPIEQQTQTPKGQKPQDPSQRPPPATAMPQQPAAEQSKLDDSLEEQEDQLNEDQLETKEDIQTLFNNLANVIAECADQKERIDQLVDTVRIIESGMVTKQFLMDMISDKADKGQINTKVSYDEFGKTVEELHAQLHNLMVEGYQRNENWKKVTSDLAGDLSEKLDKIELAPIRAFFKGRLKKLEDRVLSISSVIEEPDPAGTRKLLKDYNCLSCDRKTNISGNTNCGVLPSLGGTTAMPSAASHRTYDLHRLRTQRTKFDADAKEIAELEKQMKSQSLTGRKPSSTVSTGRSDKDMMQIVNRYVGSNAEVQGKTSLPKTQSSSQQPIMSPNSGELQSASNVVVAAQSGTVVAVRSRVSNDFGNNEE